MEQSGKKSQHSLIRRYQTPHAHALQWTSKTSTSKWVENSQCRGTWALGHFRRLFCWYSWWSEPQVAECSRNHASLFSAQIRSSAKKSLDSTKKRESFTFTILTRPGLRKYFHSWLNRREQKNTSNKVHLAQTSAGRQYNQSSGLVQSTTYATSGS